MEQETRRGPNGCVIALAVIGGLAILGTIAFCGAGYVLFMRFQARHAAEQARTAKADDAAAASVSAKAKMQRLVALPPPVLATSADRAIVRDEALILQGVYTPKTLVENGKYALREVDFGSNDDFGAFEHKGPVQAIPPLEFVFDVTAANGKAPSATIRLAVQTYRLTREHIEFSAYDARIGEVRFSGAADPAFLIRLDDTNHSPAFEDAAVITGDLTVGDQVVKNVGFSYLLNDPSED